jgi:hypothetical protein
MTLHQAEAAPRSRLARFVRITAIFAFAGPAVGALTEWTMLLVAHTFTQYGPPPLYDTWNIIIGFMIGGYLFGFLPGLVAGLCTATLAIRFGRSSFAAILPAPAMLCAGLLSVVAWANPGNWDILAKTALLFVPSSLSRQPFAGGSRAVY